MSDSKKTISFKNKLDNNKQMVMYKEHRLWLGLNPEQKLRIINFMKKHMKMIVIQEHECGITEITTPDEYVWLRENEYGGRWLSTFSIVPELLTDVTIAKTKITYNCVLCDNGKHITDYPILHILENHTDYNKHIINLFRKGEK